MSTQNLKSDSKIEVGIGIVLESSYPVLYVLISVIISKIKPMHSLACMGAVISGLHVVCYVPDAFRQL